ncbi:MAG: SufE family protein [Bacteroidetes bacterium]|mgnify:FL=1|jgi:cysteine desulfuration protein SufE|nr:SufE family protein [Bacteroidota bacterium]MBT6685345.1 SufE family protein [Bacteroidota bacterium]MBT7145075.1 SufE family protein [Bacteroidota bacterium]MBT7492760.1 SufE family protein [Bacteroidota bacterium]
MTINEIQNEIIDEFSVFDEWLDKYNYLIDLSKELQQINPDFKTNENVIDGCQSKVWLHAELRDGILIFSADSDAIITKGIIALLVKVLSNQKPKDIIANKLYFIDKIGLQENLSPTRSNGLLAMVKQMKLYAIAYDAKMNQS